MAHQPIIRPMQADDLAAVCAIEQAVQSHPWRLSQLRESLDSGQRCTVLVLADQVIGFCILQPVLDEANLLLMAIMPSLQGKGFGQMLLLESLALLPACMMVFLEVRVSNAAAIRLYEKSGFNQMGLRKNYYPANSGTGKEDAMLMALTLGNPFV